MELTEAIAIISDEINGLVTFNDKHKEALEIALDALVRIRKGQVTIRFGGIEGGEE